MAKNRTNQILELLTKENKIEVSLLAERLNVSQVTIRKDLSDLESKGIVVREHGFALLRSADDINGRIAYHYEEKKKIAACAAELVSDGETLMIENGSCCALLAEALTSQKKDLTIITNSAFIADFIRGRSDCQVILLGGIYQKDSQVLVGPMVRQCASNFCVDTFFIGTDGYSPRTGFTNNDHLRAQAVLDMATVADRIIVLTEGEKFEKHGVVPLGIKDKLKVVITDQKAAETAVAALRSEDIDVIMV